MPLGFPGSASPPVCLSYLWRKLLKCSPGFICQELRRIDSRKEEGSNEYALEGQRMGTIQILSSGLTDMMSRTS